MAAAGCFLMSWASASALAASSNTVVGATVPIVTTIGTGGCPAGLAGTTSFGTITLGSTSFSTGDCVVTWSTNASTSMLRVFQTDGTGAAMTSGGNSFPDYVDGATDWDQGSGAFGSCLRAVGATSAAGWVLDAGCTPVDGSHWNAIPATPTTVSRAASADSAGEARLRFGIRAGATQPAGSYSAGVTFEVVAPDAGPGGSAPTAGTASITGTASIGSTLTASISGFGMGSPAGDVTYQWRRCGTSGGTCIDIAGATASTYVPTGVDGGRTIRVIATVTNVWGSAAATSTQTAVVPDTIGLETTSITTSGGVNVTAISPVQPASIFEGDLLVAQIAVRDGTDIVFDQVPSGWTLIRRTNSTDRIAMATYWKFATASEPASYTWGWTNPARRATGAIQSFSAIHPTTPIPVSSGAGGDSATATAPSVVVPSANSQLLALFATRDEINFSDPNVPAMTELWELTNPGNDVSSYALHEVRSAGATGTRSATVPGTSEWAAQLVVVEPLP